MHNLNLYDSIQKLLNAGFDEGSIKVKLSDSYNAHLKEQGQETMSAISRYDFHRGIEYACRYLLSSIDKQP